MLARTPANTCVECAKPYGAPDFALHGGKASNGPAYWSDRGVLCGAACAESHFRRRIADGTFSGVPSDPPFGQ